MNTMLWLLAGGVCGWLVSRLVGPHEDQETGLNVVVGIVGGYLGGRLLSPLFGVSTGNQGDFSFGSLLVSILGAAIVLGAARFIRRRASY
jgi:uncharacterized membrane protein YeaQ/YmgE (transglycosylase-associated protein family)